MYKNSAFINQYINTCSRHHLQKITPTTFPIRMLPYEYLVITLTTPILQFNLYFDLSYSFMSALYTVVMLLDK